MILVSSTARFVRRAWATDRALCVFACAYWLAWSVGFEVWLGQPDGVGYYVYAQSLVVHGNLSIADEIARWGVGRPFSELTELGHTRNLFGCGTALLWLPFVAVAHLVLSIAATLGAPVRADGYAPAYLHAICLGSAVYGFLALVLCYRVASRFFARERAMWATVAVGTLSSLWHYLFFEAAGSHAVSAFADALFVYLLVGMRRPVDNVADGSRAPAAWLLLGFSAGLAAMVRWQEVVLLVVLALFLVLQAVRARSSRALAGGRAGPTWERRPARALIVLCAGAVAAFLPQMAIWWMQFGTPLAFPQGKGFLRLGNPVPLFVLFSSYHGLYSWTPIVLFATMFGLPLLERRDRWLCGYALSCFALQIFVNSAVMDPGAGVSYGARRFVALSVFYVLGFAALLTRLPRALGLALTFALAAWTVPLWLSFHAGFIDRIRYVTSRQVGTGALRAVQDLPELAAKVRFHALDTVQGPLWLAISAGAWLAIAIATAIWLALRIPTLDRSPSQLKRWALVVAFVDSLVMVAVARSSPVPAPVVREGAAAMIDFGGYANSRYDGDPFEPDASSYAALPGLHAGTLAWGVVPFTILPPAGDTRFAPSVVTTCFVPTSRFVLSLEPRPTSVLHLALGAVVASPGIAVLTIRVEYQDGTFETRTLYSGRDVWDFFATPPRDRVIHAERGSITGYSFALDSRRVPARMVIANPPSTAPPLPCSTLFAATQQHAPDASAGSIPSFSMLDLAAVANANHAREPFRPALVLNHFPDLSPGRLRFGNVPFLVLDHNATPSGESVITTAYFPGYRVRIPLSRERCKGIAFLLDGGLTGSRRMPVADFAVEYDRGPRSVVHLWSERDVRDYWLPGPSARVAWRGRGAQDLTYWEMPVDSSRIPRYLWILGAPAARLPMLSPGLAVFAITQLLDRAK